MGIFIDFVPMLLSQLAGSQELARIPEPSGVTAEPDNVVQYDQVMTTKLALAYAAGLRTIHQTKKLTGGSAIDLACGPGHYTLCLARYLDFDQVTGIDLSPGMVETANRNAARQSLEKNVIFRLGDVTNLSEFESQSVELSSFTGAAHHLSSVQVVGRVVREMDRVTKPDGLVMVMDLARLRTKDVTERYIDTLGQDYVERGLPSFLEDFRNSMYAAWTVPELRQAIPRQSSRYWCHLVPRGLPSTQIILGLPAGQRQPFLRSGVPWSRLHSPIPPEMKSEWRIMSLTLALASKTMVPPAEKGQN